MSADFTPPLKPYSDINKFKFWCQKVLPIVYDDSLSYYEVLNKVVNYLNEVIENMEDVEDNVKSIYDAFVELQDYVNEYFDSQDWQSMVNNKIDQLIIEGYFEEIIEPLVTEDFNRIVEEFNEFKDEVNDDIDDFKQDVNGNIQTQNENIAVLVARMDTFASLPDGSTAGDAELLDIRVGANGVTYPSAGDAVREQIENVGDAISVIEDDTNRLDSVVGDNDSTETISTLSGIIWDGTKFVSANSNYDSIIIKMLRGQKVTFTVESGAIQNRQIFLERPVIGLECERYQIIGTNSYTVNNHDVEYMMITFNISSGHASPSLTVRHNETGLIKRINHCDDTLSLHETEIDHVESVVGDNENTKTISTLSGIIWDGTKFVSANTNYDSIIIKGLKGQRLTFTATSGTIQNIRSFVERPELDKVEASYALVTGTTYTVTNHDVEYLMATFNISSGHGAPVLTVINTVSGIFAEIEELANQIQNPLEGAKILCFGDSITEFADVSTGKSYPDYLMEISGADVVNVGIGGTRLAPRRTQTANPTNAMEAYAALDMVNLVNSWIENDWSIVDPCVTWLKNNESDDNTDIINRLKANSLDDTDIIIIMIGGNDVTGGTQIGTVDSTNVSDYSGAFNTVINNILTEKPNVKIYVFTNIVKFVSNIFDSAHFSDTWTSSQGVSFPLLNEQIEKLSKKWHLPCGDMYWSLGWNEISFPYYLKSNHTDGSHPTRNEGFKIIAEHINSFIVSNLI